MGSRSRSSHRWLGLVMVMVVLAAGGVLYGVWRTTAKTAGGPADDGSPLSVRYRTDTPATAPVGKPWLEVINNSGRPVALHSVTLRYYFSDDGAGVAANCVQTALDCANVTQVVSALPVPAPGATHYLRVGFTSAAGTLAPGETSQGIGLQLYRLDREDLDQADDRSFDPSLTHYAPSTRVTGYVDGALSWGEEPGPAAPAASPRPSRVSAVTVPSGTLFDNFHYTDITDPAVTANGWQARTDGGGPGIADTWSADAVSFPANRKAKGGQVLQLQVSTDGTRQGTRQAELIGVDNTFLTGTIAARVRFADEPTDGRNGDHIIESFCTISPESTSGPYSELDFEYQPNGGWGAPGPKLDTTSWRSAKEGDRTTRALKRSLVGWHTLMITAVDGRVSYSIDGREVFRSGGETFPRAPMRIHLNAWLIDLPFAGDRTWNMQVNWVYSVSGKAVSVKEVQRAVDGFYRDGINYVNTTADQ
ncbi:cellulose binding domain-containing protein [Micromonospora coxensis]|uniref:Cellulose binding domain-containing protein n=1 Tax=Micromonospora coxensis TaxID=356852 RepID=A0A1C5IMH6_9ACTN|nr:cellulose binding domain-containing protein [Micromonospora coxensis]SCG59538.1 Cellulose binding domain-containing protein [Micromonospora coxensis]